MPKKRDEEEDENEQHDEDKEEQKIDYDEAALNVFKVLGLPDPG